MKEIAKDKNSRVKTDDHKKKRFHGLAKVSLSGVKHQPKKEERKGSEKSKNPLFPQPLPPLFLILFAHR